MESIVMPVSEQLKEKTNTELVNEVKETLANEAIVINEKTRFTAVDMWNRNRNSRSASDRMRKWNLN